MRVPSLALILLVVVAAAGCHGSSAAPNTAPANTQNNPGPNSTLSDPGPNNTANGPETLQGTLAAKATCDELDGAAANEPKARYQLTFVGATVVSKDGKLVITSADGDRTVGPHDTIFVAGRTGATSGPCGRMFRVEKVVAVNAG